MFRKASFECPVVKVVVTVIRQTFTASGIGSSATWDQHDYSCSRESSCEHRTAAACRVQQLNE